MADAISLGMRKPAQPASAVVESLQAELAALVASDAAFIDELDRRRRELAADCAQLLECARRAAVR